MSSYRFTRQRAQAFARRVPVLALVALTLVALSLVAPQTVILPAAGLLPVSLAAGAPAGAAGAVAWQATSIEVSYPIIDTVAGGGAGGDRTAADSAIDDEIAFSINEAIRELALELVAMASSFGSVSGEYHISLQQDGLISLTLLYSGFGPYMAHPMHYQRSLTADLRSGQIYNLPDLFSHPGALERLTEMVQEDLARQDVPLLVETVVLSPRQDFYLTPDALVIYFQLYEVAPYAWGFPEVVIPYERLTGLVPPDGPIARLARLVPPEAFSR